MSVGPTQDSSGIASTAGSPAEPAIHPKHVAWIEARGISADLAAKLGLETVERNGANWLAVPYVEQGRVLNHKYRLTSEKRHMMDPDAPLILWNLDALDRAVESGQPWVLCEGEWDAMTALQLEWEASSVPNGAPSTESDDPANAKRYDFLWRARDQINRVSRVILAIDDDPAGKALRADLIALIGADRCSFVEYPFPCKDLNEVLNEYGPDAVHKALREAKPVPVAGLYRISDFPDMPEIRGIPLGIDAMEGKIEIVPATVTVFTGYANMGKALALDTPIPTPTGWSTMGDLRIGDEVFAADGSVCTVKFTSDIQHGRNCYAVKFRDGETIIADEDHLWLTDTVASRMSARNRRRRGNAPLRQRGTDQSHKRVLPAVRTTREIAETLIIAGRRNHSIPAAGALHLPSAQLPIDPYLLGVWLGDGATNAGVITSADAEIPAAFAEAGFPTRSTGIRHNVRNLVVKLRGEGVFGNKHVPTRYKRASREQRLAMLQGLMDTDGHCDKNGACEFVSTNETLASDVFELAASLGIKATLKTKRATLDGRDCGTKHLVRFHTHIPVFRLARKLHRLPSKTTSRCDRFIVSIEKVASVPVRCIQVNHPSALFLAGRSMVPTHNTTVVDTVVAHSIAHGLPVCIGSFETAVKPILRDGIARALIGCSPNEFAGHHQRRAAYDTLEKSLRIISNALDEDLEFDIEAFLDLARIAVTRDGAKLVILDPWNELEHKRRKDETLTEYVGRAIRAVKRFARLHNVAVWIVAHPTKPQKGVNSMPSLYDVSDSANWSNKADYGLVYHRKDKTQNEGQLAVVKVRKGLPGECCCQTVKFDYRTSRIAALYPESATA